MRVALIAVGSELLHLGRRDTNGDWLSERLQGLGVEVGSRIIVGDKEAEVGAALAHALRRAEAAILTGGLGPTADDRTRQALAQALDLPLVHDPALEDRLRDLFAARGLPFGAEQAVQAWIPRGGRWIDNPLGSAHGIHLTLERREVFALPGVPAEMHATFEGGVRPVLEGRGGALARRTLKFAGRTESYVDVRLRPLAERHPVSVTLLIGREGIEAHLLARGADAETARARVERFEAEAQSVLGPDLYGRDEQTLPQVVGTELARRGAGVATAESCTAGLLAVALTEPPGASSWFRGGLVVYADRLKEVLAGVDPQTLRREGAVSEAVARELADAARRLADGGWGIGITGVAGPSGGSRDKPVGLVHVAWSGPSTREHRRFVFGGDRSQVRRRTVNAALDGLRRLLLRQGGPA